MSWEMVRASTMIYWAYGKDSFPQQPYETEKPVKLQIPLIITHTCREMLDGLHRQINVPMEIAENGYWPQSPSLFADLLPLESADFIGT